MYLSIVLFCIEADFCDQIHIFSIFRELQNKYTFAPLQIQILQIFSNFSFEIYEFSIFLQILIFSEICSNQWFFAEIFTEFLSELWETLNNFQNSRKNADGEIFPLSPK